MSGKETTIRSEKDDDDDDDDDVAYLCVCVCVGRRTLCHRAVGLVRLVISGAPVQAKKMDLEPDGKRRSGCSINVYGAEPLNRTVQSVRPTTKKLSGTDFPITTSILSIPSRWMAPFLAGSFSVWVSRDLGHMVIC